MIFASAQKRRVFEVSGYRLVGAALLLAFVYSVDTWKERAQLSPLVPLFVLLLSPLFHCWQLRGGELLELTVRGWRPHKHKGMRVFARSDARGAWTVTIESQGEKLLQLIGDTNPLFYAACVSSVFGIPFDKKDLASNPRLSEAVAAAEDPEQYRVKWGDFTAEVFGYLAYVSLFMFAIGKCS